MMFHLLYMCKATYIIFTDPSKTPSSEVEQVKEGRMSLVFDLLTNFVYDTRKQQAFVNLLSNIFYYINFKTDAKTIDPADQNIKRYIVQSIIKAFPCLVGYHYAFENALDTSESYKTLVAKFNNIRDLEFSRIEASATKKYHQYRFSDIEINIVAGLVAETFVNYTHALICSLCEDQTFREFKAASFFKEMGCDESIAKAAFLDEHEKVKMKAVEFTELIDKRFDMDETIRELTGRELKDDDVVIYRYPRKILYSLILNSCTIVEDTAGPDMRAIRNCRIVWKFSKMVRKVKFKTACQLSLRRNFTKHEEIMFLNKIETTENFNEWIKKMKKFKEQRNECERALREIMGERISSDDI